MRRLFGMLSIFVVVSTTTGTLLAQEETPPTSGTTVHVIQPGENLFRVALQYGLTTDALATANNITDPSRVFAGQTLIIPNDTTLLSPTIANEPIEAPSASDAVEVIIVPNGDETTEIETPSEESLPAQPSAIENSNQPLYHTIASGETLRTIAASYNTTESELIRLNNLTNPDRILSGQQLLVGNVPAPELTTVEAAPVAENSLVADAEALAAETNDSAESTEGVILHTVQAGEYASAIARRYGVDVNTVIAANNITDPDQILVGQQLVIPNGADAEV
ncbi:MAG: LysM peptidoglycan-binding domain-containing protein, partial [Chloroflexota bacterium]